MSPRDPPAPNGGKLMLRLTYVPRFEIEEPTPGQGEGGTPKRLNQDCAAIGIIFFNGIRKHQLWCQLTFVSRLDMDLATQTVTNPRFKWYRWPCEVSFFLTISLTTLTLPWRFRTYLQAKSAKLGFNTYSVCTKGHPTSTVVDLKRNKTHNAYLKTSE